MKIDFSTTLYHHITFLDASIDSYMPAGLYRDFYQWSLSEANPQHQAWSQLIGLPQFVKMTATLLEGLVSDEQWYELVQYSLAINTYLLFETISDNLGIGIIYPENAYLREHVTTFNNAMLARLENRKLSWQLAMGKLATQMEVSAFAQSLSPHKHQNIAQVYAVHHPNVNLRDLEYGLFPSLVANIESCHILYNQCALLQGGALVQAGLRARYEGMNKLVNSPDMSLDERIHASTDAILVIPTLGYYISVLAECFYHLPDFGVVLASGQLDAALREAALIVRFLNDLGALTRLPMLDIDLLLATLKREARDDETILELICRADVGAHITRLQKDAVHGELNLALHGIGDQVVCDASLKALKDRLFYLQAVYATSYTNMEKALCHIEQHAGFGFVRTLLERFVGFHERMYNISYREEPGEYAV